MTPQERAAPLHSKPIQPLDVDNLKLLAKHLPERMRYLGDRLIELLKWINDPEVYGVEVAEPVTSDVELGDIEQMLTDDLIEMIPHHLHPTVKRWAKFFGVYERKKHRRRGILWPRQTNDQIDYECLIELKSLLVQMGEVRKGDVAVTFDVTASFHHWVLSPEVQLFFCFRNRDGKVYKFKRGVMGYRPMAELMDVAAKILAFSTYISAEGSDVTTTTHIDNVRFLGTATEVEKAAARFRANCAFAKITLNEEAGNKPHMQGDFCGVVYDYANGTTCATPAILEKLHAYYLEFRAKTCFATAAAFFGVLFHVSAVLRAPLDQYYYVVKWYRKVMGKAAREDLNGEDPITFWPSARSQLDAWMTFLVKNKPTARPPERITSGIKMFTDASKQGWGAVLFLGDGVIRVAAGSWDPVTRGRDISELETSAVTNGAIAFEEYLRNAEFELWMDNTSSMWSIGKGYARAYHLNTRVAELFAVLRPLAARFTVHYVPSAQNVADGPSRGTVAQLSSPVVGMVGLSKENLQPIRINESFRDIARGRNGRP
jgi:hypothetical protein